MITDNGLPTLNIDDVGLLKIGNSLQYGGFIFTSGEMTVVVPLPEELSNVLSSPLYVMEANDQHWHDIIRQTDLLETEMFSDNPARKVIVRKSQRQLDAKVSWQVFKRDGYTCRYCGADNVPLTYDHVMLWEKNGPNTVQNGITACKKCNKTRGNMEFGDWLASPYYQKVSHGLSFVELDENRAALEALRRGDIKPKQHKRSR